MPGLAVNDGIPCLIRPIRAPGRIRAAFQTRLPHPTGAIYQTRTNASGPVVLRACQGC